MSLIIASNCDSKENLSVVDLAHSDREVKFIAVGSRGEKALKATDWQFAYYCPEDSDLLLSFADSPGMTRLLVFTDGNWRTDRVGEYGDFYNRLYREAAHTAKIAARKGKDPEVIAGGAIKAVYYGVMSGKPVEWATSELALLLPPSWRHHSVKIIEDIRRAALEFNPVEKIE